MPKTLNQSSIANVEKNLRYISTIIKQKGREILSHYPITLPQFIALQWLLEEGDLTIGVLSQKIALACSTTTDLVDRLEKNELVERVRDPNDRRVIRIHLLEKGKSIINEVIKKRQEYLNQVLNRFSEEQMVQLQDLLELLHGEMMDFKQKEGK